MNWNFLFFYEQSALLGGGLAMVCIFCCHLRMEMNEKR